MITPSKSVTSWILNPSRNERIVWMARKALNLNRTAPCIGQVIAQGGSGRKFYRFRTAGGVSVIVMCYTLDREENPLYADIAGFLHQTHVKVPRILHQDAAQQMLALEDLGDVSLFQVAQKTKDPVRLQTLYRAALDQACILHRHGSCPVKTMPGFCDKLYRWERQYFMENLVARWAKADLSAAELQSLEAEGEQVANELMRAPTCLVHRDFQSQNLLIHQEHVWLIDFQGLRTGHAAYDVASLLYDPYVKLNTPLRASLLDWYIAQFYSTGPHAKHGSHPPRSKLVRQLNCAAFQRLMQALGAYAFLGLVKDQPHFLRHILHGLENLAEVLDHLNEFSHTAGLVQKLLVRARAEKSARTEAEPSRSKNRISTVQVSANPSGA
jgi:aminoglycoside/choline kinase family phosphotransferase